CNARTDSGCGPPGTRRGSPQRRFLQLLPIDPTRNQESRGRRLPAGRRRHTRWSSSLESLCGVWRGCGKAPCAPPQLRVRRRLLGPRRRPNLRLQTVLPVLSCLLPYDFLESRAELNLFSVLNLIVGDHANAARARSNTVGRSSNAASISAWVVV